MYSSTFIQVRLPKRMLPVVVIASVGLGLGVPGADLCAAVQPVSQERVIITFASAQTDPSMVDGDDITFLEPGSFDEAVTSMVVSGGNVAQSEADQVSFVEGTRIDARGQFSAEADIEPPVTFAGALGVSRLSYTFILDAPTPFQLSGFAAAAGNGNTHVVIQNTSTNELVYFGHIADSQVDIVDSGVLPVGTYAFVVQASGEGQAFEHGSTPASGEFDVALNLDATADVTGDLAARPRVRVAPNPVRDEARIFYDAAGAEGAVRGTAGAVQVVDASGRVVKSFEPGAGGTYRWDTRAMDGRFVPAGVYFVRAPEGGAARFVVIR